MSSIQFYLTLVISVFKDKMIRVIDADKVYYTFNTNSGAGCLYPYSKEVKNPASKAELDKTVIFGLNNGSIINVNFGFDKPALIWNLNLHENEKASGVSLIKQSDFSGRGVNDLIVSRDDSSIEFLTLNSESQYELQYRTVITEGITGLDAGNISIPGISEFIISTYSGRIIGYMDAEEQIKTDAKKHRDPKETEKKIKALRAEIDKLKQTIDQLNAEKPNETTVVTYFL